MLLSCLALSIELRLSEPHGHSRDLHNHIGLPQLRIGTGGEMWGAEQPQAMARGAKHHAEQMMRSGAGVLARSGCSGVPLSSTFLPGKRRSPLTSLFAKGTESWEQPSGGCLPRAHGRARGWMWHPIGAGSDALWHPAGAQQLPGCSGGCESWENRGPNFCVLSICSERQIIQKS